MNNVAAIFRTKCAMIFFSSLCYSVKAVFFFYIPCTVGVISVGTVLRGY